MAERKAWQCLCCGWPKVRYGALFTHFSFLTLLRPSAPRPQTIQPPPTSTTTSTAVLTLSPQVKSLPHQRHPSTTASASSQPASSAPSHQRNRSSIDRDASKQIERQSKIASREAEYNKKKRATQEAIRSSKEKNEACDAAVSKSEQATAEAKDMRRRVMEEEESKVRNAEKEERAAEEALKAERNVM